MVIDRDLPYTLRSAPQPPQPPQEHEGSKVAHTSGATSAHFVSGGCHVWRTRHWSRSKAARAADALVVASRAAQHRRCVGAALHHSAQRGSDARPETHFAPRGQTTATEEEVREVRRSTEPEDSHQGQ